MLLMDALINFSMSYLPAKRGGKMDACLVMTTILNPAEVDKEAHNLDLTPVYPLEFYEATLTNTSPARTWRGGSIWCPSGWAPTSSMRGSTSVMPPRT